MVEIGEISSAWGIVPQEVKTVKDNVWRIKAVDGEYALKRSGLSPAKLQFIAEAQSHLTHCGFQYFSTRYSVVVLRFFRAGRRYLYPLRMGSGRSV